MSAHVVTAVALLVVLAGCTSGSGAAPQADAFTPPAWFAQQAQQREEYRSALQSCLDGKGWHLTVNRDGGVDDPLSKADMERFPDDVAACRTSMGLANDFPPETGDELRADYAMLLDTWRCLVAQGLDMAQPMSEEAWVDESEDTAHQHPDLWHPYSDKALTSLTEARQTELEMTCPQPWAEG